jgi:Ran-binding protein 1
MSAEDESNPPTTTTAEEEVKDEEAVAAVEKEEEETEPETAAEAKSDDANPAPSATNDKAAVTTTGEEDEDKPKEEESTATFEPIIQLDEVEVHSGTEEEETLCTYRAKLFLYGETLLDKGTGKKSWKERGIGDARILRHRHHQRLRFLMRQEKTMKVIANHALDPRIVLEANAGSDRSWVWSCYDFAEGELEEKVFALRFTNSEVAEEFKKKYQECQAEMARLLAGEDAPTGGDGEKAAAAEEVTEALGGLSTKDEE